MKGARIRYQQTGGFHFLTFSCYRRRPYLSQVGAMERFEDALERMRQRYLFVVGGYVAMPEHVHLLVNEPQRGLLSRAIQALKLSVSVRSRERPFWQAHYYDRNVASHEEFVEKLRYIHRNPVKRGLAGKPEDWRWSSYRHYQTGMRGTVEIESEVDSPGARLEAARVDAVPGEPASLPGPQKRGTGGTIRMRCEYKTGSTRPQTPVTAVTAGIRPTAHHHLSGHGVSCTIPPRNPNHCYPFSTPDAYQKANRVPSPHLAAQLKCQTRKQWTYKQHTSPWTRVSSASENI
jgi:putative transposase